MKTTILDSAPKEFLRNESKNYLEAAGPITAEELEELGAWADPGNSPYDNPYFLCGESGNPMDFINALRITNDMCEHPSNYSWGDPTAGDNDNIRF